MFPTPVGMNRVRTSFRLYCVSVPHTRGDEPVEAAQIKNWSACSPHPWG